MGEMMPETPVATEGISEGAVAGQENSQPVVQSSGNPAWQPFLNVLPDSLHSTVTPVLQEWDRGVQSRFQEIHAQYEPYKAYKDIVDAQVDPESIQYALGIFEQLNSNPRAIYDALGQLYADEWGLSQQQTVQQPEFGEEGYVDPRVAQLEEGFKQLASVILSERQQQEQAQITQQEDAELDTLLTEMRSTHGDFNERVVLGLMLAGMSPDEAMAEYKNTVGAAVEATKRPPAPGVISQGGVVAPSQNVRNLSGKDTRALVAQYLEQANRSD